MTREYLSWAALCEGWGSEEELMRYAHPGWTAEACRPLNPCKQPPEETPVIPTRRREAPVTAEQMRVYVENKAAMPKGLHYPSQYGSGTLRHNAWTAAFTTARLPPRLRV